MPLSEITPITKALSIKQPWAWLIVNGYKDIENRDWKTKYRGPVYIHASKRIDFAGIQWIKANFPYIQLPPLEQQVGGIVGKAVITDCVDDCSSPWFMGKYGFKLAGASPLPIQYMPGKLGFFKVELSI